MASLSLPRRFWNTAAFYTRGVTKRFIHEDVLLWSGGIAFKVLVTFLPLSLLAFGIFGIFLRKDRVLFGLSRFLESFLPGDQTSEFVRVLQAYAGVSNTVTVIGGVMLLLTGVSLFTTLRTVLENVFHKTHVRRSTIKGYLSDLRMAVLCGVLFLSSMIISFLLTNLSTFGFDIIEWLDIKTILLEEIWTAVVTWLGYLIPLVITGVLFFLLYHLTPRPRPSARSSVTGAVFAGISWELAKHAFALVARHTTTFERLRNVDEMIGLNALVEAFILIVVVVFWMYYSSVILVIGAMMTALRDERMSNPKHNVAESG